MTNTLRLCLTLPLVAMGCGTATPTDSGSDDVGDTASGDTSTDSGTDSGDTASDTADTGTDTADTGTDTGTTGANHIEAEVDGVLVSADTVAGYVSRTGNALSFSLIDVDGFPYYAVTLYDLTVGTEHTCAKTYSGINYAPSSTELYYANYVSPTSCTYTLSAAGTAIGEQVIGTFSGVAYDITLTNSKTLANGKFNVTLSAYSP